MNWRAQHNRPAYLGFALAAITVVLSLIPATRMVALLTLALAGAAAGYGRYRSDYPTLPANVALIAVGVAFIVWAIALYSFGTDGIWFYDPNAPQRKPSLVELGD